MAPPSDSLVTLLTSDLEAAPCDHEAAPPPSQLLATTAAAVQAEQLQVEEGEGTQLAAVCGARHGGPLDYPALATGSATILAAGWRQLGPGARLESARQLVAHHARLAEQLVGAGQLDRVAGVLGGLALVRNQLWGEQQPELAQLYRDSCQLVESLGQQLAALHSCTLASLVQDSESQDWEQEKPWHEGERCSYCVQVCTVLCCTVLFNVLCCTVLYYVLCRCGGTGWRR